MMVIWYSNKTGAILQGWTFSLKNRGNGLPYSVDCLCLSVCYFGVLWVKPDQIDLFFFGRRQVLCISCVKLPHQRGGFLLSLLPSGCLYLLMLI